MEFNWATYSTIAFVGFIPESFGAELCQCYMKHHHIFAFIASVVLFNLGETISHFHFFTTVSTYDIVTIQSTEAVSLMTHTQQTFTKAYIVTNK